MPESCCATFELIQSAIIRIQTVEQIVQVVLILRFRNGFLVLLFIRWSFIVIRLQIKIIFNNKRVEKSATAYCLPFLP